MEENQFEFARKTSTHPCMRAFVGISSNQMVQALQDTQKKGYTHIALPKNIENQFKMVNKDLARGRGLPLKENTRKIVEQLPLHYQNYYV